MYILYIYIYIYIHKHKFIYTIKKKNKKETKLILVEKRARFRSTTGNYLPDSKHGGGFDSLINIQTSSI